MMVHIRSCHSKTPLTFINTDAVLIDQARKRRARETFDPSNLGGAPPKRYRSGAVAAQPVCNSLGEPFPSYLRDEVFNASIDHDGVCRCICQKPLAYSKALAVAASKQGVFLSVMNAGHGCPRNPGPRQPVGPTIFANGVALCDDCNGTQGVKFLDDWVKEEGFELSDLGERQVGRFIRFKEWWAAQNHPALECVGRDHPRSARRMQGVKDFIPVF